MPNSHKRQGSGRGGQQAPQADVAQEAEAAAATSDGRRSGLNIGELKDMSIQKLTQVAKELNVPVIALAQLSREVFSLAGLRYALQAEKRVTTCT